MLSIPASLPVDAWRREHAAGAEGRRVARPFIWLDQDGDPDCVVGYDSLTGHRLVPDDPPRSIGQGSPAEIPAVLLARLALDIRHQGGGHGAVRLVDALARIVIATPDRGRAVRRGG